MNADPLADLTTKERLRLVRLRRRLSLNQAAQQARAMLPVWVPMSREIIRRLETGVIRPEDANPFQFVALARVYDTEPQQLVREINLAREIDHLLRLLMGGDGPEATAVIAHALGTHPSTGAPRLVHGTEEIADPEEGAFIQALRDRAAQRGWIPVDDEAAGLVQSEVIEGVSDLPIRTSRCMSEGAAPHPVAA